VTQAAGAGYRRSHQLSWRGRRPPHGSADGCPRQLTRLLVTVESDPNSIDLPAFTTDHLQHAEPDLLRSMLSTFVRALMSAGPTRSAAPLARAVTERTNSRNGYRTRDFDTRTGTMEVAIPKRREGSYFPDWLLERRRRAESAPTRRMEKLVETLGITRLSRQADEQNLAVFRFGSKPLLQNSHRTVTMVIGGPRSS
jgi:hypothetical protein